MTTILTVLLTAIVVGILIIAYIFNNRLNDISMFLTKNESSEFKIIDKDTAKLYINELNKMISYYTIYSVDSKFGEVFTKMKKITNDVSVSDLMELKQSIIEKIFTHMGKVMYDNLVYIYGEKWLQDFINMSVTSLLINHTNLNIEDIAKIN